MRLINDVRLQVWRKQPVEFFEEAIIEGDGTIAPTTGECKQGMDISYDGIWGYHPLVISLANTQEPLFLVNRSGNRPSHEGAAARFDQAVELCRRAGFRKIKLRGDTDFSQARHLDRQRVARGGQVLCGEDDHLSYWSRRKQIHVADQRPIQTRSPPYAAWQRVFRHPPGGAWCDRRSTK